MEGLKEKKDDYTCWSKKINLYKVVQGQDSETVKRRTHNERVVTGTKAPLSEIGL